MIYKLFNIVGYKLIDGKFVSTDIIAENVPAIIEYFKIKKLNTICDVFDFDIKVSDDTEVYRYIVGYKNSNNGIDEHDVYASTFRDVLILTEVHTLMSIKRDDKVVFIR